MWGPESFELVCRGMVNCSLYKADNGTGLVILASTVCDGTWEALQTERRVPRMDLGFKL